MDQIAQQLKKCNRILIVSHVKPDGDAIGSLVALGTAMDRLGKRSTWYNESSIPSLYRFMPIASKTSRSPF